MLHLLRKIMNATAHKKTHEEVLETSGTTDAGNVVADAKLGDAVDNAEGVDDEATDEVFDLPTPRLEEEGN